MSGNIDMVKLLLQHGADIGIRGKDGRSAEQVAEEQGMRELAALLRAGLLLEGPDITEQDKGKRTQAMPPPLVPRALPPPRHNPAKMAACRCFEATMVEFYTEGREQRYQQSAPVYEVLYGKGPKAILDAGRPVTVAGKTPKFTWYHLPATNVCVPWSIYCRKPLGRQGANSCSQMEWVDVSIS
jgi:ankyrin repeat protein